MSEERPIEGGPTPALERRLATILAADVAGYSRLMGENEEATVQTMRGHRGVFDALLKQHHGRVFNTAGDMILAEFPSAVEAVRCATEVQAALRTRNEHLAPERRMVFRMGINLGDVVVQDGDLLGDGVNVAARIQTIAEPGGICISSSVYDQIQNKLSLQFKALGDRSFKNIGQPIRMFSVVSGDGTGALPTAPRFGGRGVRMAAAGLVAAAMLAAGGYWFYGDYQAKRVEQTALTAQLAAQKQATEDAERALDEQRRHAAELARKAEEEHAAAEAAKREAALKLQAQASDDARRRAEADRARLEDDLQKARTDASAKRSGDLQPRRVANAAAAPAASARASAKAAVDTQFDGTYNGVLCNHPSNANKQSCWPVELAVRKGEATGSWTARIVNKPSYLRVAVGSDGTVDATLDGWKLTDATPLAGAMRGRLVDNHIDLSGRWATGLRIDGHWTRTQ